MQANAVATELANRGRVLLADDDQSVLRGASLVLRSASFEVDTVATGHEATELLGKHHYDAFVADINMPGNGKLELIAATDGGTRVPMVLITGNPSLDTALSAFRSGVLDYIVKPFQPEELLERVSRVVHMGRERRAVAETRTHSAALLEAATQVLESAQALAASSFAPPPARFASAPTPDTEPLSLPAELVGSLSPRQIEVVRLLAMGHPIPEVAELMGLSVHTARGHMKGIFSKLGVTSQVALLGKLAGHAVPTKRAR